METKCCKKCNRPLPEGYKSSKCESCQNKSADNFKQVMKGTLGVLGAIGGVFVFVATKGKIGTKK